MFQSYRRSCPSGGIKLRHLLQYIYKKEGLCLFFTFLKDLEHQRKQIKMTTSTFPEGMEKVIMDGGAIKEAIYLFTEKKMKYDEGNFKRLTCSRSSTDALVLLLFFCAALVQPFSQYNEHVLFRE